MARITVSAVIPTYNGTRYLAEAVRSALAQSYPLLEVIVIDDGSSEDIPGLLAPFGGQVRYVRQENAGPAAARNRGISMARGELIAFLDDDDLWHPDKTAAQVDLLMAHPTCGMVYSQTDWIDENGQTIPYRGPVEFPSGWIYLDMLHRNRISTPSATLVRRSLFEEVGGFDENREYFCGEDYDLWLRISRDHAILYCPGHLVSYRMRASGISRNLDNAIRGDFYVLKKMIARHHADPKVEDAVFYRAFDQSLYHVFTRFAYLYYYGFDDRARARELMWAALNRHVYYAELGARRTKRLLTLLAGIYNWKDLFYLLLFNLPDRGFELFRDIKRKMSTAMAAKRTSHA